MFGVMLPHAKAWGLFRSVGLKSELETFICRPTINRGVRITLTRIYIMQILVGERQVRNGMGVNEKVIEKDLDN